VRSPASHGEHHQPWHHNLWCTVRRSHYVRDP